MELRAVFKQLSTDFGIQDRVKALNESDRFECELAAYKVDRLIGLDMVPVTVLRTIKGHPGALQFWINDAINVRKMLEQKVQPGGWCDIRPQYNLMNVFDILIHNTDRTQENALFTKDWTLVLIDHTRAFPALVKNPTLLYKGRARGASSTGGTAGSSQRGSADEGTHSLSSEASDHLAAQTTRSAAERLHRAQHCRRRDGPLMVHALS